MKTQVGRIDPTWLREREPIAVVRDIASLAFNRAQGRALVSGSNGKFIDFVEHKVYPLLHHIESKATFHQTHDRWVGSLQELLRTTNGNRLSYGQGQKSLNVWLKFYVDFASRPDPTTAKRLRPWLHCPLDRVVMEGLKANDSSEYKRRIVPYFKGRQVRYQQRHSLSIIDKELYEEWQMWIRDLCPCKPVMVDMIWSFEQ